MEILAYAAMLTVVVVVFLVLIHFYSRSANERGQHMAELAVHAHEDALQLILQDRAWHSSQMTSLTRWCETVVKAFNNMAIQSSQSAQREILEVQKYMEVFRQDLIGAVSNAACEGANRTRPMPVAAPPHINPTQRVIPPPPAGGAKEKA